MSKSKRTPTRKIARSAVTGRFRTLRSARRHPRTSVVETIRTRRRKHR